MVSEVLRSCDLDAGGDAGDLPDLVVCWAISSPTSIESPTVGRIAPVYTSHKGHHCIDRPGFFLASGPGVVPGALDSPAKLVDFAPTIASLLGAALEDTDGVPLTGRTPTR